MGNYKVNTYKDGTGGGSKHSRELIKFANINISMTLLFNMNKCLNIKLLSHF